jgi:HAD superfamily hydrolase (TIGR01493 family)
VGQQEPQGDVLDEIISVEEVKIFKTSNRVYWLATERLKVSNPELGFVSANNWDGVAAVSAGCERSGSSVRPPKFPKSWASRST